MATLQSTNFNQDGYLSLPTGNIAARPGSPATGAINEGRGPTKGNQQGPAK